MRDNWLKTDLTEEYNMNILDLKFITEKGFFHVFGELFTSEINFVRNDAPDRSDCVLSLGKEAGKSICPEQESFQNGAIFFFEFVKSLTFRLRTIFKMKTLTACHVNSFIAIFSVICQRFIAEHDHCIIHKHV